MIKCISNVAFHFFFSLHVISLFYRTFACTQRDHLRQHTNKFRYCYFLVTYRNMLNYNPLIYNVIVNLIG